VCQANARTGRTDERLSGYTTASEARYTQVGSYPPTTSSPSSSEHATLVLTRN
jgi:hypothetical protein